MFEFEILKFSPRDRQKEKCRREYRYACLCRITVGNHWKVYETSFKYFTTVVNQVFEYDRDIIYFFTKGQFKKASFEKLKESSFERDLST